MFRQNPNIEKTGASFPPTHTDIFLASGPDGKKFQRETVLVRVYLCGSACPVECAAHSSGVANSKSILNDGKNMFYADALQKVGLKSGSQFSKALDSLMKKDIVSKISTCP